MPLLQELLKRATTPAVSEPQIAPRVGIEDYLTQPELNQSPTMARLKGFGAGMISGLRNLSSPIGMAGMMDDAPTALGLGAIAKFAPRLLRGAAELSPEVSAAVSAGARDILNPATARTMGSMYEAANPTFKALAANGAFAGDRSVGGLHSLSSMLASKTIPAAETLGEVAPDFTPVGGETLYNVGKVPAFSTPDPTQQAYMNILSKGGR